MVVFGQRNLHNESKQLINSMMASNTPSKQCPRLSSKEVMEEFHDTLTLAELRRLTLRESAEQEIFIDLVGEYLDETVKNNDHSQGRRPHYKPSFLIERISKDSGGSPCCCLAALIYLERFLRRSLSTQLTSTSFQRLLIVASMTANKYLEDHAFFCHNKTWAAIGGLPLPELNALELRFLFALDFDLSLPPDLYALRARLLLLPSSATAISSPAASHSQSPRTTRSASFVSEISPLQEGDLLPLLALGRHLGLASFAATVTAAASFASVGASAAAAAAAYFVLSGTGAKGGGAAAPPAPGRGGHAKPETWTPSAPQRSISAPSVEAALAEPDSDGCLRPVKRPLAAAKAGRSPTPSGPDIPG